MKDADVTASRRARWTFVVAYAESDSRVHLDDRNVAPLTVDGAVLDHSRAQVGSYQNAMFVVRTADAVIDGARLESAVSAGLAEAVAHLSSTSDSFSLPAWRKWARGCSSTPETQRPGQTSVPTSAGCSEHCLAYGKASGQRA